jgi:hypothetical protein
MIELIASYIPDLRCVVDSHSEKAEKISNFDKMSTLGISKKGSNPARVRGVNRIITKR